MADFLRVQGLVKRFGALRATAEALAQKVVLDRCTETTCVPGRRSRYWRSPWRASGTVRIQAAQNLQ